MTSLYLSKKRTRVHNQGEFLEQKDPFGYLLEPVSFGLIFSNKDSFNTIQKKKLDHISGKYSYPRPGSKSTSTDRESVDKASISVDLHLGIHSFSFTL